MGNLPRKTKHEKWPRQRVLVLLSKLRAGAIAKGIPPSAVEMADRLQRHLWKRSLRGDQRSMVIVSELLRTSLVQLAGGVNRIADRPSVSKNGHTARIAVPAVQRRDQDGKPLGIRETPAWRHYTLEQLLEARDNIRRQYAGLGVHLEQLDFVIELFSLHAGQTVEEVCLAAGVDPYSLDLDQILEAI